MMREPILTKEYRVLALAIVFFAIGMGLFLYDRRTEPAVYTPPGAPVAVSEAPTTSSPLKTYPEPRTFKHFSLGERGALPAVSDICHAPYLVALVFPASVDYRNDPARALVNHAFVCTAGEAFHHSFSEEERAHIPAGVYYMIIADQKASGTWYNPR